MYKDEEGRVRISGKAVLWLVLFLLGMIIGFNLSEGIHADAKLITIEIMENASKTTKEDVQWLAECVYYENYCNGIEAMYLTGMVVRNRRDFCSWCPNTIKGVLTQKGQYSTIGKFFKKPIPSECYVVALRVLLLPNKTPHDLVYQAQFKQGSKVYKKIGTDYFCQGD